VEIELYSRTDRLQFPSKWIIEKHIGLAITEQNILRRTVSKLGEVKARPKKEPFYAVSDRFLLTDSINRLKSIICVD